MDLSFSGDRLATGLSVRGYTQTKYGPNAIGCLEDGATHNPETGTPGSEIVGNHLDASLSGLPRDFHFFAGAFSEVTGNTNYLAHHCFHCYILLLFGRTK